MRTSVVMGAYNGERYIERQLRSILRQTRPVDEVIITDDRSTDSTPEVVRRFMEENYLTSWRFGVNERNLGFAANFQKAVSMSSGDIIFYCDQDDEWALDRVEVMAGALERNPDIGLLNTRTAPLEFSGREPDPAARAVPPQKIKRSAKTFYLRYPGCAMAFRRSLYDRLAGYLHPAWAHDDYIWAAAFYDDCCYETPYVSMFRRTHEGQASGQLAHSFAKRVGFLSSHEKNCAALVDLATREGKPQSEINFYARRRETFRRRLELVRDKKFQNMFPLLFSLRCYQSPKSFFTEPVIALKGGKS